MISVIAQAFCLLSTLLFGAAHLTPWVLLPISLLGVLLGVLVWRTGSTVSAWLGHALFNLFSFLQLAITGSPESTHFEAIAVRPLALGIGGLLLWIGLRLVRADSDNDTV